MLRLLILTVALALASPTAALAKGPKDKAAKREKVREKIKQMRAARLIELLDLDDATANKLFAVIDQYDDLILPLRKKVGEARRELKRMIDSGTLDDAVVNRLVDTIFAARAEIQKLESQRLADVRKILTPRQVALVVVYLPEIDRLIEQEIRKALRGKRGPGLGAGGGDEPAEDIE
jgi:Spy/CpxP family protein refolding chaperone